MAKSSKTAVAADTAPARTNQKPIATQNAAENPGLMALFTDELRAAYWIELQLVKVLPKMLASATATELSNAIAKHLEETKEQVARLEQAFGLLNEVPRARKCEAMEGLNKDGEVAIEMTEPGSLTRDIAIIMASRKVEHHEMATYESLHQLASTLGLTDIANLLDATLTEEQQADLNLRDLAEDDLNDHAGTA